LYGISFAESTGSGWRVMHGADFSSPMMFSGTGFLLG
jgi:hypothetical protein